MPRAGALREARRAVEPHLHLDLFVKPGTEPIAGWLTVDGERRQAFTGYLEFMALIERVLSADGSAPGSAA